MSYSNLLVESLYSDLEKIRSNRPLILNITNQVASNFSANVLLALGASPLMAHEHKELSEIVSLSNALVLNIGTLDEQQVSSMKAAIEFANDKSIPVVIDPVGSGASQLRTSVAQELLDKSNNCLVKGNASEINSLLELSPKSKGVDSLEISENAIDSAKLILKKYELNSVVISGEKDFVVCHKEKSVHFNGDEMMTRVTGMGCSLTAVIAAFSSINLNYSQAARNAISLFGVVGQIAGSKSFGPGSFQSSFLDTLFSISEQEIHKILKVNLC